jgi:uroporphyrinogen-III synthase
MIYNIVFKLSLKGFNLNLKNLIDSLDLIYYEFDPVNNVFERDGNYYNVYTQREFTKITYYLSKNRIKFDVLKDKTIVLCFENLLVSRMKRTIHSILEDLKNSRENIYILNDYKVKWAKNISLFKVEYIEKDIDLTKYDAIVFTSKNAIESINSFNRKWKELPAYAISSQIAKIIKNLNGNLKHIGKKSQLDDFAYDLLDELKGKKVLYLRGQKSISNLVQILNNNDINCEEEIVYNNVFKRPEKKRNLPKKSKIIFSSPSTIEYFFKCFDWDESYYAICIGERTAEHFPKDINPIVSENNSFYSCVRKAIEIG